MRTKGCINLNSRFRGTTSICRPSPGRHTYDRGGHPGPAVTGGPVSFYSPAVRISSPLAPGDVLCGCVWVAFSRGHLLWRRAGHVLLPELIVRLYTKKSGRQRWIVYCVMDFTKLDIEQTFMLFFPFWNDIWRKGTW